MEWRKSLACALALAGMMAFGPGVRQAALAADTHNLTILGGGSGVYHWPVWWPHRCD